MANDLTTIHVRVQDKHFIREQADANNLQLIDIVSGLVDLARNADNVFTRQNVLILELNELAKKSKQYNSRLQDEVTELTEFKVER